MNRADGRWRARNVADLTRRRSALCQSGNDIDAQRLVIHLGHRDEHSAAGEKWHEFNEHKTSLSWRVRVLSLARTDYVVCWEDGLTRLGTGARRFSSGQRLSSVYHELERIIGRESLLGSRILSMR